MRLMIRHMAVARREARLEHLVIENRPGDDLMHNDLWLCAHFSKRVIRKRASTRSMPSRWSRWTKRTPSPMDYRFMKSTSTREEHLVALYRRVKAQTLEERNVGLDCPEDAIEVRKNIGRGHSSSMWLMACRDGIPSGYALANLADEQGFEGLSAWG